MVYEPQKNSMVLYGIISAILYTVELLPFSSEPLKGPGEVQWFDGTRGNIHIKDIDKILI